MKLGAPALAGLVLLLPLSIEVPAPRDSGGVGGETRVSVVGGIGRYAIIDRGCEGQVIRTHPVTFREVGGEIEHRFPSGVAAGLRGGTVSETATFEEHVSTYPYYVDSVITVESRSENHYVNPFVSYESRNGGVGVGWIVATDRFRTGHELAKIDPSFHIRIGPRDRVYFMAQYMENVPLLSGGGYAELGFGVHPHRLWDVEVGVGGEPYDGPGLTLRADYRMQTNWALVTHARLGDSGGEAQTGAGIGLSYVSRPPIAPATVPHEKRGQLVTSGWGLGPRPKSHEPEKPIRPREERLPEYGEYQYVDSLPVVLSRADPVYPDSLRAAGVAGTVNVAALVGASGAVIDARVMKSIPDLDAEALACVRQWRFRPAVRSGRAVAYWLVVPVTFGSP